MGTWVGEGRAGYRRGRTLRAVTLAATLLVAGAVAAPPGHAAGWQPPDPSVLRELARIPGALDPGAVARLRPRPVVIDVPGDRAEAMAVGETGWVVGHGWGDGGWTWAFRWRDGTTELLVSPWQAQTDAVRVNAHGQVAGTARSPQGLHVVLWQPDGSMVDLSGPADHAEVTGLTDSGTVVAHVRSAPGGSHDVMVYDEGGAQQVEVPDAFWYGYTRGPDPVNERGEVVGTFVGPNPPDWPYPNVVCCRSQAFVWRDGQVTLLATAKHARSSATQVNERGTVLGAEWGPHRRVGNLLWRGGVPEHHGQDGTSPSSLLNDLDISAGADQASPGVLTGTLTYGRRTVALPLGDGTGAHVLALNDRGVVVGGSSDLNGPYHATAWVLGVPVPLGEHATGLDGVSSVAEDVNDSGRVVGRVEDGAGGARAVVWDLLPR